jgi:glutamate-1-semialdehyde 2,1-aminomutase
MLQYYLRAAGLALGWIGTGRFIFSHDIDDAAWQEIEDRFVRAAEAMREDGWWWVDAAMTNKSIKRRVLGEIIRAELARGSSDRSTHP